MKKILERMAQIAYSINLVNGFDTEVEVLPALKIAELAKASPASDWVRGLFVLCCPPNSCGRNYQPAVIIFLYRTHKKG